MLYLWFHKKNRKTAKNLCLGITGGLKQYSYLVIIEVIHEQSIRESFKP